LRYDHPSTQVVAKANNFLGIVDVPFCFCFPRQFLLCLIYTLFSQHARQSHEVIFISYGKHAVSFSRTFTFILLTAPRSYLLGSGGTLMFDVTIVAQSFIYRPHPRTHESRSLSREVTAAEEESLMQPDDVDEPYTSRRRLPVTAEEADVMD
jgi:hypothetical protein